MRTIDGTSRATPREAVEDAVRWVLESGIQEVSGDDVGAFRSWEDPDDPGFPYSEVTGYGITALCGLESRRDLALERAHLAGRWLVDRARRGRAYACRKVGGRFVAHGCSFDNGVILRGLCALSERTGDRTVLDAAGAVADWIVDAMQEPSGFLTPRMDLATGVPLPSGDRWSSRPGAYQARAAFALLHAARLMEGHGSPRPAWVRAATRLCERVLGEQEPDGGFVTDGDGSGTYLHAHAYAVEGLAACGAALGREDLTDSACRGLRWACALVDDCGAVPARFHPDRGGDVEEHSDTTAQVLRLVLVLGGPGPVADRLAARLMEFQCRDDDPRRRGGFRYARRGAEFGRNVTTHGTLFAIQALGLYAGGVRDFEWWDLT